MTTIAETYLQTWNAADATTRAGLLTEHWTEAATYTDPMADVAGRDQISATIDAVREQFPGFVFTLVGEPDAHHGLTRFHWGLGPAGAEPLVIGFDVVISDEQGRIQQVLGFLDKVPA
ncbi:nuclear transport factor 2 family protein [Pseudactinotalea terrae]|uniref:nuclear transport factor 2 family protein n=1 Tax=Pseudactinotalea terrae TaxID=1743262 RepID=UPI0012E174FA|nr:nuclear transport factor 2 family protein [Pseudactinotalea terrae]